MKKEINIALVLYTQGLDFDDRIRKEIMSISELSPNIKFKIFAVTPKNEEKSGFTTYGIPYRLPFLKTRAKYKSGGHLLEKAYDFYHTVKKEVIEYDIIWCADTEILPFLLFINNKPMIWDLHELPSRFMNGFIGKTILKYIEKKCFSIIHANTERFDLLFYKKAFSCKSKHLVLRNYPSFNEIDKDFDEDFINFKEWKKDSRCVYLQGLTNIDRADVESVEAVLSKPKLKCVVIGNFNKNSKQYLLNKYKEEFEQRVFFTGMIKQLKTPQYIKECFTSLIFYKDTCPNNLFCEPNRMFQNVINGNPIVVGLNPPMKEFVNQFKCGVSVDTDGCNVSEIVKGLEEMIKNYDYYKQNALKASNKILWSNQNDILKELCDKINSIK